MSRVLRQTDKTVEELRATRLPISKHCSKNEIIKSKVEGEPDELKVTYCNGAAEIRGQLRCTRYAFPNAKWRNGALCPMATHVTIADQKAGNEKVRVGQQKQKKKSRRK